MNRRQLIADYERVNRQFEVQWMPRVKRALHAKTAAVIARLREGGYDAAFRYVQTDFMNQALADTISRLYLAVGMRHARMNYSRMLNETGRKGHIRGMEVKGFGFSAEWIAFITQYFEQFLMQKITFDVATTTRDALLRALTRGNAQGWGVDKMIDAITDWPYERFQAARIVRTEVNRAANVGAKANSETLSYQQVKEWISAEDHRVRGVSPQDHASHVMLNGQKIDADDKFTDSRNGDALDVPGDINASAASTVNCRCHVAYTAKRDMNGNLIPKRRTTVVQFPSEVARSRRQTVLI